MPQRRFGSQDATGRKLDVIDTYLSMYQIALKNTQFRMIYIDGFAGTGEIPLTNESKTLFDEEVKQVISGSAPRALRVKPPFSRYVFIDNRQACIDELRIKLNQEILVSSENISFVVGDADLPPAKSLTVT